MPELLIDFITLLDGYASADGWPGWWGLEGPEYLGWLATSPEADYTILIGATTYRVMYGFAVAGEPGTGSERIYDSYPDVALDVISSRTFDGRIQLLEYVPKILAGPPGPSTASA